MRNTIPVIAEARAALPIMSSHSVKGLHHLYIMSGTLQKDKNT